MSVSGDDDDLPTCECGQTMTIEKGTIPMWRCNMCEELKASVLKYTCACGRSVCDECAWLNCGEEIEEEWEEDYEDYEEWDECCEIGASNFWNGCDHQYQHQEEQWQDWTAKLHRTTGKSTESMANGMSTARLAPRNGVDVTKMMRQLRNILINSQPSSQRPRRQRKSSKQLSI